MTALAPTPRTVALPDGSVWPALGLGTWRYGEEAASRAAEVAAVRRAFEIGWRLIDTAEMYAEGGAESVVGQALADAIRAGDLRRDDVVIVTKVYPHNAAGAALQRACEASLRRLGIDCIDAYLLHWRGGIPLHQTVEGLQHLAAQRRIARWGVSNFDVDDLTELFALPGGAACVANQVYHSIAERGPEFALLPWQQQRRIPLMAYSPIDQGALAADEALGAVALRHDATPAQVALAALLRLPGVMPIPKTADPARLLENWRAQSLVLTTQDEGALDAAYPAPRRKRPLQMR